MSFLGRLVRDLLIPMHGGLLLIFAVPFLVLFSVWFFLVFLEM